MTASGGFELRHDGASVRFVLRRPEARNAITPEILAALDRAIGDAEQDPAARVVVIETDPGEPFSSGFDFEALRRLQGREAELEDILRRSAATIEESPVPVVAAIERFCIGAALELALACDLRVAAAGARFALPVARIGRVYPVGGVVRFIRAAGLSGTAWLQLTAETIDAQRALAWGLVHEIVPAEELPARVDSLVGSLLQNSPNALAEIKRITRALRMALEERAQGSPAVEAAYHDAIVRLRSSGDYEEGVAAYLEKRPARWVAQREDT